MRRANVLLSRNADEKLSTNAEPSYWRSSQRTAGGETTNTPAANSRGWRSSTPYGRVRLGRLDAIRW